MQADAPIYELDSGTHADFGTDGILTWGRWIGQVTLPGGVDTYSANQGLHYVIGIPTAVLPTNGATATYVVSGGSAAPLILMGARRQGAANGFTGSLSVTFGPQAIINGQFQVLMPDRPTTPLRVERKRQHVLERFSLATTSSSGCASACKIATSGFFAGPSAERVGVACTIRAARRSWRAAFRR